ncbi:MAG TPA: UDP-N-acetylglucosamine 2-epimerase [Nonomuraea sp.]|nr:UDP-N-acetylglucosamine 2-epimerase [Nonomuraea sp.]
MRTIAVVLGTRPEAITLAPVVRALRDDPRFAPVVISTGERRRPLHETLDAFGLSPDLDLRIMPPRQTPAEVTCRALRGLAEHLVPMGADAVLVRGDTATALAGAIAGFHHRIPVAHAGVRDGKPFPEGANRRLVAQLAALHLAATPDDRDNLVKEGVEPDRIVVTGDTAADALRWAGELAPGYGHPDLADLDADPRRVVLAVAHASWPRWRELGRALAVLAGDPAVRVVAPLPSDPAVREALLPVIGRHPGITVVDPLPYVSGCRLRRRADVILTDGAGEEDPGPARPTLLLRDTEGIVAAVTELLAGPRPRPTPYGDGRATGRTIAALARFLDGGPAEVRARRGPRPGPSPPPRPGW